MNSHEIFIHIHQGCFAGTGAIVRLPQCQWSKPDGYWKISQCITTTKHSKAKTVSIFLGIYCNVGFIMVCGLNEGHITPLYNKASTWPEFNRCYRIGPIMTQLWLVLSNKAEDQDMKRSEWVIKFNGLLGTADMKRSPKIDADGFHCVVLCFVTQWGRGMHICISKTNHHCSRWWLVTWSAPSHYLNQCCHTVN